MIRTRKGMIRAEDIKPILYDEGVMWDKYPLVMEHITSNRVYVHVAERKRKAKPKIGFANDDDAYNAMYNAYGFCMAGLEEELEGTETDKEWLQKVQEFHQNGWVGYL
jgi:hypothetical protein